MFPQRLFPLTYHGISCYFVLYLGTYLGNTIISQRSLYFTNWSVFCWILTGISFMRYVTIAMWLCLSHGTIMKYIAFETNPFQENKQENLTRHVLLNPVLRNSIPNSVSEDGRFLKRCPFWCSKFTVCWCWFPESNYFNLHVWKSSSIQWSFANFACPTRMLCSPDSGQV